RRRRPSRPTAAASRPPRRRRSRSRSPSKPPEYPGGVRNLLDWAATTLVALAVVLAFEAAVAKPYRVPPGSMEPTLHWARPADDCEARVSDRVIACELCFRLESPHRGQIVVFHAPAAAASACPPGGTFVKRLIGLPGNTVHEDAYGAIWIDGRRLAEPYVATSSLQTDTHRDQTWHVPAGRYFFMGDNRGN